MGCVGDGKRNTLWGWPLRYTGLYTEFAWNLHSVTKYPQLPPQALRFPSRAVEASAKREWLVTIVFKSTHRSRHPKLSHAIWNLFLRNASFRRLLLQFHFPSNSLLHFGSITGVLARSRRDLELHSRVSDLGGWLTPAQRSPALYKAVEGGIALAWQTFESICCRRTSTNGHLELSTTAIFLADSPYIHSSSTALQRPPFYNGHLLLSPRRPSLRGSTVLPEKLYNTLWTSLFSKIYQSSTLVILPVSKPAMFSKSQSKPN